jgi:uncharacterized protein (TIGR02453 family)
MTAQPKRLLPSFTKNTFVFLRELKDNNTREWFASHKSRYEAEVLAPALEFLKNMQPLLPKLSSHLTGEPKRVGGALMRIYRDTRFSKDKTPYKTNLGIHFRHRLGSDVHAPGLYVHIEPDACFLAAGMWMPPSEPLAAIRQSIHDDPAEWNKVISSKAFSEVYQLDGESLKTAPRGFDPKHPAIEHIRRKSFAGVARISDRSVLSADFCDFVLSSFKAAKPLMKFLCDALGQPY